MYVLKLYRWSVGNNMVICQTDDQEFIINEYFDCVKRSQDLLVALKGLDYDTKSHINYKENVLQYATTEIEFGDARTNDYDYIRIVTYEV